MFKNGDVLGNTPMIKINYKFRGKMNYVYVKLEYFSLTGSIKDRVAYYMINNAKKRGELNLLYNFFYLFFPNLTSLLAIFFTFSKI